MTWIAIILGLLYAAGVVVRVVWLGQGAGALAWPATLVLNRLRGPDPAVRERRA